MPIVYLPMTEPVIGSMPEVEINAGSTVINDLCFIPFVQQGVIIRWEDNERWQVPRNGLC